MGKSGRESLVDGNEQQVLEEISAMEDGHEQKLAERMSRKAGKSVKRQARKLFSVDAEWTPDEESRTFTEVEIGPLFKRSCTIAGDVKLAFKEGVVNLRAEYSVLVVWEASIFPRTTRHVWFSYIDDNEERIRVESLSDLRAAIADHP